MKTIIIDGVEYNLTPKVAFREGDWVIDKQGIVHQIANVIENVTNHTYAYDIVGGGYFNDNTEGVRLWTIQDAKDGDVLAFDNDTIVIFKDLYNSTTFHSYCHIEDGVFDVSEDNLPDWWEGKGFYPATKEQRDLLFTKMKEAGYEWDSEKKELKLLITNGGDFLESENRDQNPAWSKEDEKEYKYVLKFVDNILNNCGNKKDYEHCKRCYDWLKSLRPQNNITDEELAQAKKDAYNDALDKIEYHSGEPTFDDGWSAAIWYLKKRNAQPQNRWKPSDDEIEKASQEWDSKAIFNPFYMTMDGDKPTGVKQDITTHKESFKAVVEWILKKIGF